MAGFWLPLDEETRDMSRLAGVELMQFDLGLETERGKRLALWCLFWLWTRMPLNGQAGAGV